MPTFTDVSTRGNLGPALRTGLLPRTWLGFARRRFDFGCRLLLGGQAHFPRRIGLDHRTLRMDAFPGIRSLSADRAVLALCGSDDRSWLLLAHGVVFILAIQCGGWSGRSGGVRRRSGLFAVSKRGKSRLRERIAAQELLRNQQTVVGELRQRHAESYDVGTGKAEHLPGTRPKFPKNTQHFKLFRGQRGWRVRWFGHLLRLQLPPIAELSFFGSFTLLFHFPLPLGKGISIFRHVRRSLL